MEPKNLNVAEQRLQPGKEKKSVSMLKNTARITLPALAVLLVAGSAYAAHAWTDEVHQAQVELRQASFFQTTAAMKAEQQPALRFALSDGPISARTDATALLLAANTPVVKQPATGLYVDGSFIGAIYDGDKLQDMLVAVLNNAKASSGCTDAAFMNKIEIVPGKYEDTSIVTNDAMLVLICGNRRQTETYAVERGDTVEMIAKKNGLTSAKLKEANPDLNLQSLHAGDVIQLEPQQKLLTVQTKRTEAVTSGVAYEKQTVTSNSMYEDQTAVKAKGVAGQQTATYEVTCVNGREISRRTLHVSRDKAPVTEVTVKGTKTRASTAGEATGCFLWPTPTLTDITSGYEARWGTFHYGLDLSGANAMGQPIYAADGGTVVFAGYDDSGYGNYVVIDHGNGFESIYGHASKLLISQGAKVAQGQLIALVGSTGHSTGPHCHFEVHKNGEKINPTNLISANTAKVVSYLGQKVDTAKAQNMVKAARLSSQQSLTAYQKSSTVKQ